MQKEKAISFTTRLNALRVGLSAFHRFRMTKGFIFLNNVCQGTVTCTLKSWCLSFIPVLFLYGSLHFDLDQWNPCCSCQSPLVTGQERPLQRTLEREQ